MSRRRDLWVLTASHLGAGLATLAVLLAARPAGRISAMAWVALGAGLAVGLAATHRFRRELRALAGGGGPARLRERLLEQVGEAAAREERSRLAVGLHEAVSGQLAALDRETAALGERFAADPGGAWRALAGAQAALRQAMTGMQTLLRQLRPAVNAWGGLAAALREQCDELGDRTGGEVTFEPGAPIDDDRLPATAQQEVFEIARKTLRFFSRHFRTRRIRVRLTAPGALMLFEVESEEAELRAGLEEPDAKTCAREVAPEGFPVECRLERGPGARIAIEVPLPAAPEKARAALLRELGDTDYSPWLWAATASVSGPRAGCIQFVLLVIMAFSVRSLRRDLRSTWLLLDPGERLLGRSRQRRRAVLFWFGLTAWLVLTTSLDITAWLGPRPSPSPWILGLAVLCCLLLFWSLGRLLRESRFAWPGAQQLPAVLMLALFAAGSLGLNHFIYQPIARIQKLDPALAAPLYEKAGPPLGGPFVAFLILGLLVLLARPRPPAEVPE
jgi:hypothetical protein